MKRMELWQRLITPTSTDPDEARRQRLLNITLVWITAALLVILVFYVGTALFGDPNIQDWDPGYGLLAAILVAMGLAVLIYWIGRRWSGGVASVLWLAVLTIIAFVSDDPQELIEGRSLINLVIPIILASVLLPPWASLAAAGVIIAGHLGLAFINQIQPSIFAIVTYGIIAAVSWLAASQLEQALKNLRQTNRELDQRVVERTQELSQALLREQTEASKSRAILDSIADSVLVFDPQSKLILANPAFSKLSGKTLPKMLGLEIDTLMGRDVPKQQRETVRVLLEEQTLTAPVQIDWRDKILSLSLAPVQLESGQLAGTVVILHDVTYEVEIGRIKSSFVAMVSHELHTPLNDIQGLAKILEQKRYGPLTEKQQGVTNRILTNTQRLMDMVKDLLDHAQIEAGTLTIQDAPLTIASLANSLPKSITNAAQAKGLQFAITIEPGMPPTLLGDLQRLNQVLLNLLTNAVKFTEKGRVSVRFYRPDPTHWALAVSDTGIGIPSDAQENIFTPFWRADDTIGRKYGGTGLGLSIAKRLVDLMNGKITLESQVSQGSLFTIVFPLRLPEDSPDSMEQSQ